MTDLHHNSNKTVTETDLPQHNSNYSVCNTCRHKDRGANTIAQTYMTEAMEGITLQLWTDIKERKINGKQTNGNNSIFKKRKYRKKLH